jgi:hypothetical protein
MTNISKKVLEVWLPSGAPETIISVTHIPAVDLADQARLAAVPGGCSPVPRCIVPAGAVATAFNGHQQPVVLAFAVLPTATVNANIAGALASWIESRATSPGRAWLQRVQRCALNAQKFFTESSPYIEDTIRSALEGYAPCRSLLSDVARDSGQAAEQQRAVEDVVGVTKKLAGGSFNDELVYSAIKIFSRR